MLAFLWKAVAKAFGFRQSCHPLYPDEKSGCSLLSGLDGTANNAIWGCREQNIYLKLHPLIHKSQWVLLQPYKEVKYAAKSERFRLARGNTNEASVKYVGRHAEFISASLLQLRP